MLPTKIKDMYTHLLKAYMQLMQEVEELHELLQTQQTIENSADIDFALSKCHEMADESAKRLKKLNELSAAILCLKWMTSSTDGEPVRTELVTSTPRMTSMVQIPSKYKEPEMYKQMMMALGASEEAADEDIFRVHWPTLVEHIAVLEEKGLPMLPGVDPKKTYPVYKVTRRKRKEILE